MGHAAASPAGALWCPRVGRTHERACALHMHPQVMSAQLSPTAFRALTSVLRTANNVLGGISFVILAKVFGVQSSAGDARKTSAKALPAAAD